MEAQRVIVGIDFSEASPALLERARSIAGAGGVIRLVHAIGVASLGAVYSDRRAVERWLEDIEHRSIWRLSDMAQNARATGAAIECEVRLGRPADELLAAAEKWKATAIVVAAHARGAVGRALIGSVAEEVARRSPIPTLIVRELAPNEKIARVLVALDRERESRPALAAAADLARRLGVPLEAVTVIEPPMPAPILVGPVVFPPLMELPPPPVEEVRAAVGNDLRAAVGHDVTLHATVGSPAFEVLRLAKPTDVLVCGTHGRGALGRLAFGSVATKLLRNAPCPTLVVRGPAADDAKTPRATAEPISTATR